MPAAESEGLGTEPILITAVLLNDAVPVRKPIVRLLSTPDTAGSSPSISTLRAPNNSRIALLEFRVDSPIVLTPCVTIFTLVYPPETGFNKDVGTAGSDVLAVIVNTISPEWVFALMAVNAAFTVVKVPVAVPAVADRDTCACE